MACPLLYSFSLTGDCGNTNSGVLSLDITGTSNFTITWISPVVSSPVTLTTNPANYTVTGLSAGTYSLQITDGCLTPGPSTTPFNFIISSGTNVNIDSVVSTTCGNSNGSIVTSTSSFYGEGKYYLYETTLGYITSGNSNINQFEFTSLNPGIYYVVAEDGGGCDGKSEACIVKSSTTFDYGLYVVNNAGCLPYDTGAIYITGLTGNSPFTYSWSSPPGGTDSYITGLTEGIYFVTVTDNEGCSVLKSASVTKVPIIGFGTYITTPPTCFVSDGEITIAITGGTAPYYYLLSNGDSFISFGTNHTFTGLSSGEYTVSVTDAGYCNFTKNITLSTPNLFNTILVTTNDSTCNNSDGQLLVTLGGSPGIYTYTLTSSTFNQTFTTESLSQTFINLPSDTYNLIITNSAVPGCQFNQNYTISNIEKYQLSAQTTGTTCNFSNGSVLLSISSGGTPPYDFSIGVQGNFDTPQTQVLFENLSSGSYVASVTDFDGCSQIIPFTIPSSSDVFFTLNGVNPVNNDGSISAIITQGEPPFTWTWSSNVNGQTGLTVNNLTAGTYSLSITDNNGCTQERQIILNGFTTVSSYQVINVCDLTFQNTDSVIKGPKQMLLEGFHDLTINDVNCVLNQSIFSAQISLNGITTTIPFFTGTSLNDYPTDYEWYNLLSDILNGYEGIDKVIIGEETNQLTIVTFCGDDVIDLNNENVTINMIINYDIGCFACNP
jgi:hypothetical protein